MSNGLLGFLAPRSVAVVGASKDPTKRGYQALRYLIADKFAGGIYPIHPKESEILGIQAFPSVSDVPDEVDLALVCTPARTLPGVMEELGKNGVKGAIILAGGFSEAGPEGAGIEEETVAAAQKYGVRIVGPNTSGVFNLHSRMNLVGMPDVRPGGLGIVSQSGNMALSIVTEGTAGGHLGFSTYVGVGNQVDIRFNEYLQYLGDDEGTQVPVLYVEGFKHGRTFLDVARDVTQKKPVVVYKSGRTEAGQASAKSHTGALAGSYEMTVDLLRQVGVTVARQSDHVVPLAEALSLMPPPASNRVAILADGGGHATIAADTLTEAGIVMPPLAEETRKNLAAILPPAASLVNPVDVAGGTDSNPGV
ncbi:MAG: CoA-binding protein, partial [Rhodospirillales bacterium]|nr:CoA-binding protein [Rhodospirillales bacterium]